ncbi:MAG: PhzF family phenazine biosynthesis protein [Motiliproteus sp.]
MKVTINVVNAFIDGAFGGNPAGVVLDADALTDQQRLTIAKTVGLSETAFVSASSVADFKLDFFTPSRQIAHCGHATVAVFSHLAQTGRIGQGWSSKETIDGTRKVLIKDGMAFMEQRAPQYTEVESYHTAILDSLGLTEQQLLLAPKWVNTGNSFVVVGVKNQQDLAQLEINYEAIKSVSESLDLIGYYIFTTQTHTPGRDVATRMLAPRYGIDEEAGTGMAAGPMACYLYDQMAIKKDHFTIEQGYLMRPPSPSVIDVTLEISPAGITSLMAGGVAKSITDVVIDI